MRRNVVTNSVNSHSGGNRAARYAPGVLIVGFTLVYGVIALDYPFGSVLRPGAGFFPLILLGALGIMGVMLLLRGRGDNSAMVDTVDEECDDPDTELFRTWRPVCGVLGSLLVFGAGIETLGLGPSVILMTLVAVWARRGSKAMEALAVAIVLMAVSVIIFIAALGLSMNTGWW